MPLSPALSRPFGEIISPKIEKKINDAESTNTYFSSLWMKGWWPKLGEMGTKAGRELC